MKRVHHLSCYILGLLREFKGKSLYGVIKDDDERYVSDEEARAYLKECIDKGWIVLPAGDCPTFDYVTGCNCVHLTDEDLLRIAQERGAE